MREVAESGTAWPLFLCTGICTGQHKGASVLSDTHIALLTIDSASLIVIVPRPLLPAHILANSHSPVPLVPGLSCLPCLPLFTAPPSLLLCLLIASSHSSPGWIIHGSSLCQIASALLIQKDSFHYGPSVSVCVFVWMLYVWVGAQNNGAWDVCCRGNHQGNRQRNAKHLLCVLKNHLDRLLQSFYNTVISKHFMTKGIVMASNT